MENGVDQDIFRVLVDEYVVDVFSDTRRIEQCMWPIGGLGLFNDVERCGFTMAIDELLPKWTRWIVFSSRT